MSRLITGREYDVESEVFEWCMNNEHLRGLTAVQISAIAVRVGQDRRRVQRSVERQVEQLAGTAPAAQ